MEASENKNFFERFANWATNATGTPSAFLGAFALILIWGICGPIFKFSETWQLVINTATTIVTFLMVFLIQKAQNKDSKAIQIKLNELIASNQRASNRIVDIEDLTEKELDQLHQYFVKIAELSKQEGNFHKCYSIDAAVKKHNSKLEN